jgi:glycine/D-amino acid oxidase-like deaminating enzyme
VTKYGQSPWIALVKKSRVPSYPKFRGASNANVVIVGGGITGCATAYALAAAGVDVLMLEGTQIGRGTTAASAGWLGDEPGVGFVELEKALGQRDARRGWHAWHRAGLDFAALLRRLRIRCALEPLSSTTAARNPEQAQRLKRERKARRAAGIEAPLINGRALSGELGFAALAGIRARDGATIDPYRAAVGLARAAAVRGARIFERSEVSKVTFGRRDAEVHTADGSIRTTRVVVATGGPTNLFKGLRRHFWFKHSYSALTAPVPAKIRHLLGQRNAVIRDSAEPPHIVRWVDGERLLVTGADSESPPDRQRDKVIVQRTGQLMYELSVLYPEISGIAPEYGWDASYVRTEDGLPYIGPHRNYPHHLFAFGDSSHTVTGAYLASRILLRHHLEQVERADEVFGFR